jgi:hypothetical protein
MGLTLAHAEQASLDHLERVGLDICQHKQEPILGCRQWAGLVHGTPASRPELPIEVPRRHTGVERGLKGWHQLLKLVKHHAGDIQERHRAGLQRGDPYTSQGACLLALSRDVRGASYRKESGINSNKLPPVNRSKLP